MGRQMRVEWNSHQRQQSRTSIWSMATKQAILLEMTVSWENRIDDEYERKSLKYQELAEDCQQNGLRSWFSQQRVCWSVQVESTGGHGDYWIRETKIDIGLQCRGPVQRDRGSTRVVMEKGVGQVTGRPVTEGGIGDGEGSGLGFDHHSRCCLSGVSEEDY